MLAHDIREDCICTHYASAEVSAGLLRMSIAMVLAVAPERLPSLSKSDLIEAGIETLTVTAVKTGKCLTWLLVAALKEKDLIPMKMTES